MAMRAGDAAPAVDALGNLLRINERRWGFARRLGRIRLFAVTSQAFTVFLGTTRHRGRQQQQAPEQTAEALRG
jgi:hypothetical protein